MTQRHIGNLPYGLSHLTLRQAADVLETGTGQRSRNREWARRPLSDAPCSEAVDGTVP
jgi:hypothetical protein